MPGVFLPALRWVTWRIASSFGPGADEQLLQVLHPRAVAHLRGAEDPVLDAPYDGLRRGPIHVGPRHRLAPVGLFGFRHPTSPIGTDVQFPRFR